MPSEITTVKCYECGDSVESKYAIETGYNYYCEDCFCDIFSHCNSCNIIIYTDESYLFEGEQLCQDCYAEYNSPSSNPDLYNSSYRPTWGFYKSAQDSPRNNLYFGIELETECEDEDVRQELIDSLPSYMYAKEDGSLTELGAEIVSHPATYKWLKENILEWQKILDFRKHGVRSYIDTDCGIHIHMTKDAFTTNHLYRFLKLFYDNPNFILRISQRQSMSCLNSWAVLTGDNESIKYKAESKTSRYRGAINLKNEDTIEVRIFRGTLNPGSFWKNIEFCQAVYNFTRRNPVQDIRVFNFTRYVKRCKKRFPNLYQFMKRKEMI